MDRRTRPHRHGRLLVTGGNGAGNSTLLQLAAGWLAPDTGSVQHRRGIRVGLFEQDVAFAAPARARKSPQEPAAALRRHPPARPDTCANWACSPPADLSRPVGALGRPGPPPGPGAAARRPTTGVVAGRTTNHLSLSLVSELEDALHTAPCAIVVASHDRWLRQRWNGATLNLHDGRYNA